MALCNWCWEVDPICTHGTNPANPCVAKAFTNMLNLRQANAVYPATVRNTLPSEVRQLDGIHLDRIINFTPAAPAVLVQSAAEAALIVHLGANTLPYADVGDVIELCSRFPGNVLEARRNMARLLGAANQAQTAQIGVALSEIRAMASAAPNPVAATAAEYKVQNYPKATLFQVIIKQVEKGEEYQEAAAEFLDPATGKKYVPFPKTVKASSVVNLMYSLQIFATTLISLTGEAPLVYFRLTKEVTRVAATRGAREAHEFLDAVLRKIDEGVFTNVVALFKSGEQNRILTDLASVWDVAPGEKVKETKKPATKDPRERIKFGPVTTPLGGPGAGIITDFATKEPKLCNRFHATPRQACTAGLPVGHASGFAGQCAFKH